MRGESGLKKKILFVAMQNSPHAAKWISALNSEEWEIYLFPVISGSPTSELMPEHVHVIGTHGQIRADNKSSAKQLSRAIKSIRPDLVHSLEFQHASYLTLRAKELLKEFPFWVASNWGSDIYYYQHLRKHREEIEGILQGIDALVVECHRDSELARRLGFSKKIFISVNSGGVDLTASKQIAAPQVKGTSILLKGYEHFAGRALSALRAIRTVSDDLAGLSVRVFSASVETFNLIARMSENANLDIQIIPYTTNEKLLLEFANAEIYLGVSVSDGLSTSAVEAMAHGAFPIQSNTSCAGEWITHGVNGYLIDPLSHAEIVTALTSALQNSHLRKSAAALNAELVSKHFDTRVVATGIRSFYSSLDLAHSQIGAIGEDKLTQSRDSL